MLKPEPGKVYRDKTGRLLTVTELRPGDKLGRDIVGFVVRPRTTWASAGVSQSTEQPRVAHQAFTDPQDYACSAGIFKGVWIEEVE